MTFTSRALQPTLASVKLLRQAGQSLRERRERLFDNFVPYLLIVYAFLIVCLVEWAQRVAGTRPDPRFWLTLSVLVTFYGGCRVFKLFPQLRRLRQGEQGRRRVGEVLDRIRAEGFTSFGNVSCEKLKSDHVVIGPAGIYSIQIKFRSGRGTVHHTSNDEIVFAGKIRDSRALRQTRDSAGAVHRKVREHLPENLWVKPLVVLTGDWQVCDEVADFDVDVVSAGELENYFHRQQPELTGAEIVQLRSQIELFAQE